MKITYTVWVSEREHFTAEHDIDYWYKDDLIKDFEKSIELRKLRADNWKMMRDGAEKKAEEAK